MSKTKTFPRIGLSVVLSLTFFLLPITSNNVSASGSNNEGDFWHGLYVEHVTEDISGNAVDIGDVTPTDSGLTTGNYIYNQTGITEQDIIDYVTEQYENATGYLQYGVEHYTNAVENVLNKTIDSTDAAIYKAEKALRKVVDSAGNVYYNVSSSNYWNGIYNKWFNNNGYKDIYTQSPDGSWNGTAAGYSFSFRYVTTGYYEKGPVTTNNPLYNGYDSYSSGGNQNVYIFVFTCDGNTTYHIQNTRSDVNRLENIQVYTNSNYPKRLYYSFTTVYNNGSSNDSWNYITLLQNIGVTSSGTEPVLQPKQCGFIIYNGDHVPIYTDKTLNPTDWTINDNGTVTIDNDGDYPAYVDEKELTDDGWLDMLDLVSDDDERSSTDKDPWGYPWDTQDDGSAIGGFFGNLVKDIQKIAKGIGDTIKKLFEKPLDVLQDLVEKIKKALKEFIEEFLDFNTDIFDIDVDNNYGIINQIFENLLECFGFGDS